MPPPAYTDKELVEGCLAGRPQHERALWDRLAPLMMAVCRRYSTDPTQVSELIQLGFIRVFDTLGQYREGALEGWVRRVVITTCLNAHKRQRRLQSWMAPLPGEHEPGLALSAEQAGLFDFLALEELQRMIAALPTGARMVFNLFAVEGYPHAQIATMLDISETNSRVQLTRARGLLQAQLSQRMQPDGNKTKADLASTPPHPIN